MIQTSKHVRPSPLTCTIHKRCRILTCSVVRTESFIPQGIPSCAIPQGTLSAASSIYLGAIHLIGRPYARLRTPSSVSGKVNRACERESTLGCCKQSSCAIISAIHE